jgi:hypothetical protein
MIQQRCNLSGPLQYTTVEGMATFRNPRMNLDNTLVSFALHSPMRNGQQSALSMAYAEQTTNKSEPRN